MISKDSKDPKECTAEAGEPSACAAVFAKNSKSHTSVPRTYIFSHYFLFFWSPISSLFKTMATLESFVTTDEVVAATKMHRRWLMEWLRGMAAAGVLEYEKGTDLDERFRISKGMVQVLANESSSLAFAAGAFGGMQHKELSDGVVRAFRTGVGMSYKAMSLVLGEESIGNSKRMLATCKCGGSAEAVQGLARAALQAGVCSCVGDACSTSCVLLIFGDANRTTWKVSNHVYADSLYPPNPQHTHTYIPSPTPRRCMQGRKEYSCLS